ncbi:9363_t:CDS:2, partial [Acaulospora morrowiae]
MAKQNYFTHTSAGLINICLNQPAGEYEEEITSIWFLLRTSSMSAIHMNHMSESVNVTAQTKGFQTILQPSVLSGVEALPLEMLEDIYYVTSDNNDNEDTDDNHIYYLKEPEYFDNLVNSVDLSYIAKEEPITASSTSTIQIITTWDSFIIDDFDILK